MFKLSCFSPNHYTKAKKVQHVDGKVHSRCEDRERKVDFGSASTTPKVDEDENLIPSSYGDRWASECLNGNMENSREYLKVSGIKKSQSLGCILDKERDFSDGEEDVTDNDELDRQFSFKYMHENKNNIGTIDDPSLDEDDTYFNKHEQNGLVEPFDMIKGETHHESLFSIQVLGQFDSKHHIDSGNLSAEDPPLISESCPVANHGVNVDKSPEVVTRKIMRPRSKSFEVSHSPEVLSFEVYHDEDKKKDHLVSDTNGDWEERFNLDNKTSFEKCDYHHEYISSANEVDVKLKNLQQESSLSENCDELSPKEFSTRRIEDWINQIDIGESSILEEPGESSSQVLDDEPQAEVEVEVIVPPTLKFDSKSNLAMEVAYNYMSSLTPTSSTAQMANIGLIAIPLLSGFSSLRVLNLSGNSIARITSGSLPRGLHMLNLSKNNIGVIEGLRDLTRLRVLDLSYNRIVRIGHGLASCSSLKELYLSGNKISEVEGLHRLLKLNLLDLKGNKISTAKGLGQLAANYASLQSINLEGNPAQRNVGDEQLKKYLLSLLPNIVHYNKHTIKSSGAKELLDRPPRSVAAHQFDRGARADHKLPRRGSHGSGLNKLGLNSVRLSHAVGPLLKQSKGRNVDARHARLPQMGSKLANNLTETDRKMVSLKPSNPIRRSRSEGTL